MSEDKGPTQPPAQPKPPPKPTEPPNVTFKGGEKPTKPQPGQHKLVEKR
jgi:hypothetical protein